MDVKHLCLGVLYSGESSGYDIKKYFESSFRHFFVAGYGSIYPALSSLLEEGYVEVKKLQQERLPDKKIYRITDTGRRAFQTALEGTKPRHKVRSQFLTLMHFAHLLTTEQVLQALDSHLIELESLLDTLQDSKEKAGAQENTGEAFSRDYALVSTNALLSFVRAEREKFANMPDEAEKVYA